MGAAGDPRTQQRNREPRDLRTARADRACARHLQCDDEGGGRGLFLRPAGALSGLRRRRSRRAHADLHGGLARPHPDNLRPPSPDLIAMTASARPNLLVTGIAEGLGAEIAGTFARAGHDMLGLSRTPARPTF